MNRQPEKNDIKSSGNGDFHEEKTSSFSSCISPESLSAYADKEYILTSEEKEHLAHCIHCREKLIFLQKLNHTLHTLLQQQCPEKFVDLMSEKVRYRIKKEEKFSRKQKLRFSPRKMFFHAAAALVLFSLIAYLVMDNPDEAVIPILPQQLISYDNPVEKPFGITENAPYDPVRSSSNIDIRNLVTVSTSAEPVKFFPSMGKPVKEKPLSIPENVKQVWLYDKKIYSDPAKQLEKFLAEKAGRNNVKSHPDKEEKNLVFTVKTTRKGAIYLVRFLAAKNFQLLSPVQPQPEQNLFYGKGDEKTVMQLYFMPMKN